MSRILFTTFTLLAFLGFSLPASAQDLKEAAARQKLAAEKLVGQVNIAIDRSYKQDPIEAKFDLRELVRRVDNSQDLTENQRTTLLQRLQVRVRAVEETARGKGVKQDQAPVNREPDRPKTKGPASDPSSGVGSVAKSFTDQARTTQKTQSDLIRERQKGITGINLGLEKGVLSERDITFPAGWKELVKRRKEMVGPPLSEKEVALLKTLNSVMSVDYDNEKLKAVIGHLQDKTGLTIIVDQTALTDASIDYEDPVSFKVQKATVRTVLKKILGDKGLTYIIKEGAIQVMTPEKASKHTVIRTYQIDDLIQADPQVTRMFGPFVAQAQMMQNAQMLINLIQQSIEPSYWEANGTGSITFFPPTKSLIIRASAEMHYQLGSPGLFGGR